MDSYDLTCPHCGYNLTGLVKPICPECGVEFDPVHLKGMARKYPGHFVLGTWTIKYIPPILFAGAAALIFFSGEGPNTGMAAFRFLAYAVIWICAVWAIDEFVP